MRRVGSRGQHNPPFLPSQWALQRGVGKGGVLGAWQRGSETQPSDGTSSNPLPRTFSSALEPFPPPAASQQSQSVILTLAAASVSEPNWVLEGRSVPVGGECLVLSSRGQAAAQPVPWPASLGGSVAVGTWVCVCPGLHAMAFPSADM